MDPDKKLSYRHMTKFQAGFFLFVLIVMGLAFMAKPPAGIDFWPALITYLTILVIVGTAVISTFIGVDYFQHPATKHIIFYSFNIVLYAEPLYRWYVGSSSPFTVQDFVLSGVSLVIYSYPSLKRVKRARI